MNKSHREHPVLEQMAMGEDDEAMTVTLLEVGPRDGLQNEKVILPPALRADFVRRAAKAGLRRIEAVSFVHPAKVPQMAEAEAVMANLRANPLPPGTSLIGLVLNGKGFERAIAAAVDEISFTLAVSDAFGLRNQGMGREDALSVLRDLAPAAAQAGKPLSVVLSTCFGCPFAGPVAPEHVLETAALVAGYGVAEIAFADTIGVAVPSQVSALFAAARQALPAVRWRGHFHNTRNTGVANAWAAYAAGASVLDASLGGIGGCPFAPAATGNVATEDLAYLFARSGVETGLDLESLIEAARFIETPIGHPVPSMVAKAGDFKWQQTP